LVAYGIDPNTRLSIVDPTAIQENGSWHVTTPADVSIALNVMSFNGATPLWLAAKHADVEFMRFLLAHGADPSIPSRTNVTPLMVAAGAGFVQGESLGEDDEALEVTKLLVDMDADVNAVADFKGAVEDMRFSRFTALHGAAQRGATSVIELLVARGAKLDAQTDEGWTPFNVADGVRIGCCLKTQPAAADLLRRMMGERGIAVVERRDPFSLPRVGSGKLQ
jgi:ankyrin